MDLKREKEMKDNAILACANLCIESLREVADYCNEMADNLEREAEEAVQWERP